MMTTMELREGKLLVPQAIIDGFELKEGDLLEVALLRAFRRGGKVVDMEPARTGVTCELPDPTGDWEDLS